LHQVHAKPRPLSDIEQRIHAAKEFELAFLQVGIDTIELFDQRGQLFIRGTSYYCLIQLSTSSDPPRPLDLTTFGDVLPEEGNEPHKLIVVDFGLALQLIDIHSLDEPEHAAAPRCRPLWLEFLLSLLHIHSSLSE
jgi:hypothetical protein